MTITELYDINMIVRNIEEALLIDGSDYSEKDVNVILNNVLNRIIRQHNVDLRNTTIKDDALYASKHRGQVTLFVENISMLHARLCGYLHVVRYHNRISVKASNIGFLGFTAASFKSFLVATMSSKTVESTRDAQEAIKRKFGSISVCIEKKMLLIMLISQQLGFDEMAAAIAEIFYIGMVV